jgi:hypothetical protein
VNVPSLQEMADLSLSSHRFLQKVGRCNLMACVIESICRLAGTIRLTRTSFFNAACDRFIPDTNAVLLADQVPYANQRFRGI